MYTCSADQLTHVSANRKNFNVQRWRTCVSERFNCDASSTRSGVDRYFWASNRSSRPFSCWSLNTVLAFRRRQCFPAAVSPWWWNRLAKWKPTINGLLVTHMKIVFLNQSSLIESYFLNWKLKSGHCICSAQYFPWSGVTIPTFYVSVSCSIPEVGSERFANLQYLDTKY